MKSLKNWEKSRMVEWKEISSLGEYFGGLTGKSKKDFENGNAKFITYMNVFSNPSLDVNSVGKVHINEGERQNKVQKGDILFSGSSETPEEAGMSCVVTEDLEDDYYMNSFCFGLRLNNSEQYNLHYFKHVLRSYSIRQAISKTASGVTRFNISKARFGKVQIPIPPIAEQTRIVSILDTFTDSIENLKQQIAQRRKQYEYYRDDLLELKDITGVILTSLGEVGTFIRGTGIQKADFVDNGFPCIHYGQIHTKFGISAKETISLVNEKLYKKSKKASKGDVILATTSEDAEGVAKPVAWLGDEDVAISGDAYIFHHEQNGKYMAHLFASHRFFLFKIKHATGTKVTRISGESMAKFELALPDIDLQNRIVAMLDKFEASISNLEAQLEQRQKQYEYYRNKLLTFE